MNKMLTTVEFERDTAIPVPSIMTRKEKLLRFAHVVRTSSKQGFRIFNNLEHYHPDQLAVIYSSDSAFAAAAADPILKDAGLKVDGNGNATVADAMKFFELSQAELHEFSCDCGGAISNSQMADRIERLATGEKQGFISRMMGH